MHSSYLDYFVFYFLYTFWFISIIYFHLIGLVGRVFTNGPWELGSIPAHVIPKTLKIVLDATLLNALHYKHVSRVKWNNPGKGEAPSPTPRCSIYRKENLLVTLDYGRQHYSYRTLAWWLECSPMARKTGV